MKKIAVQGFGFINRVEVVLTIIPDTIEKEDKTDKPFDVRWGVFGYFKLARNSDEQHEKGAVCIRSFYPEHRDEAIAFAEQMVALIEQRGEVYVLSGPEP